MEIKIAALVILYHFNKNDIENIKSYSEQVDYLIAFDNTESPDPLLVVQLKKLKNICYNHIHENIGLSKPINRTAKYLYNRNIKWLITFDQDSKATPFMIEKMKQFIIDYPKKQKIGLIAPLIKAPCQIFGSPVSSYSYYDRVIQSGALHNLDAWKAVKGYDENLFIDQVDFEYCIRLIKYGFQIIKLNNIVLLHNTKDSKVDVKYQKGKKLIINKFTPIRYYYIVRNNLYCYRKYKKINRPYAAETIRNILVMLKTLSYEPNKLVKLKAILWAITDVYINQMGKCKRMI